MMKIEPIAHIRTDFPEKFGVPRQSGRVEELTGRIIFEEKYRNNEALRGIEEFSHLWLIFDFSLSHSDTFSPTVRPPRLGGNKRVGVFASRSPNRPNSIGLSCVRLKGLEQTKDGTVLIVSGADLVDNTPIYDIKPYIPYTDCIPQAKGSYAEVHRNHKLKVLIPDELYPLLPEDKISALTACLADDPRPSYQNEGERVYGMRFSDINIKFKVKDDTLYVIAIE